MQPKPVITLKPGSQSKLHTTLKDCGTEDDRILEPGKKCIVTELALDDWIAQQYGRDLENLNNI